MKEVDTEYCDITTRFRASIESLEVGQMVHSSRFKLEEAMSSIELMEPKMDRGLNSNQTLARCEELRNDIVSCVFTDDEVCSIVDGLVGQLKLWLEGHMYIQTVHASMFVLERKNLCNKELSSFCDTLLSCGGQLRAFLNPTGVRDEEDFVGYMFGFEKEVNPKPLPPTLIDSRLSLRFEFLDCLSKLILTPSEPLTVIASHIEAIRSVCSRLCESVIVSADLPNKRLIQSSLDPLIHRDLLPPGPPRVVPSAQEPADLYESFSETLEALSIFLEKLDHDNILSDPNLSPFVLFNRLRLLRDSSLCQSSLVRGFVFHRTYYTVDVSTLFSNWLGEPSLKFFRKYLQKTEFEAFINDFSSVFSRAIHTYHRTVSRQHRVLKHVLADLSVLQQVAWDIHVRVSEKKLSSDQKCFTKTLWLLVCLIGCTLVQDNVVLNFTLNLVDWTSVEPALLYFIIETVSSVKLFILNEGLSLKIFSNPFLMELRNETITTAVEHSAAPAIHDLLRERLGENLGDPESISRLFELRTTSLQAFIIPKNITVEDFLGTKSFSSSPFECLDECIGWIDRAVRELPAERVNGSLIAGNVAGIKKALLTNKMNMLKTSKDEQAMMNLEHKCHPIIPNLVRSL